MRFNAITGTRFVTMRAAVFVLLIACPGVALAIEDSKGPFKSEKANVASKTYESTMRKARRRLNKARRSAMDAYRTVLQSARDAAMDADDLQESVKLDDAIKELDGGARKYRMEALRRRVENTTWIRPEGRWRWDFLPEGRYGVSKDMANVAKPRYPYPWHVIDVNTIIASVHPYLWAIRPTGDMRIMKVDGRNRKRDRHFELLREDASGGRSKSNSSDDFKSKKVRQAHKLFDEALAKAKTRYRKAGAKVRSAYRAVLKSVKKSTMKAHDLDEARRLGEEIKSLDESSHLRKALARAISGTVWQPEVGNRRFDFRADGTYSYNQKGSGPWKAIDENTLVAGSHPFLWVLTFDDARKRAHLHGIDGNRHYDEWMTLVQD